MDHAHVHGRQMLLGPDPGEKQDLRGVDGAAGNDYFPRGACDAEFTVLRQMQIAGNRNNLTNKERERTRSYLILKFLIACVCNLCRFIDG